MRLINLRAGIFAAGLLLLVAWSAAHAPRMPDSAYAAAARTR